MIDRRPSIIASAIALAGCASGEAPAPLAGEGARLAALTQALSAALPSAALPFAALPSAALPSAALPSAALPDAGGIDAGASEPAAPANDCCTESSNPSCGDDAIAACVCEGDPFCCTSEFDALCVKQAVSRCGLDCDARPPESDCCSTSSVPSCSDAPVAACICEIDPFCCVFRFDQSCVNLGVSRCNTSCAGEESVP